MRRREFISLLGSAAVAGPLAARAQQPMPVIGFLHSVSFDNLAHLVQSFHQGLKEAGFVEGRNVSIEYRWAEGHYDRLPALAADLVRRQVTVIAAPGGTPTAVAAKAATATIPIVFLVGVDPVTAGLVASLNQPGGNVTGISILNVDVVAKRLELLHELVPTAAVIALLVNPTNPVYTEPEIKEARDAAGSLGLQLHVLNASNEDEIDAAFATMVREGAGALVLSPDPFFNGRRVQLAALEARYGIPVIADRREFVEAGGLMSYGPNLADANHQVGVLVGRILKGARPADLPVQQVVKIELVINLKTAKTLGIAIPLPLLGRADEVNE
jgi:putative tryptophan/tyrosine transport system substrate-binding protein